VSGTLGLSVTWLRECLLDSGGWVDGWGVIRELDPTACRALCACGLCLKRIVPFGSHSVGSHLYPSVWMLDPSHSAGNRPTGTGAQVIRLQAVTGHLLQVLSGPQTNFLFKVTSRCGLLGVLSF
jgi:hypothetical protein